MQKFQHKLRTTVHARSVENIMTRHNPFLERPREHKLSTPKIDNITTYLRKFQIDRENLNLAKRIMQCESEHNHSKYAKEWKKIKKFIQVRSNFKPQLTAEEPKIFKFEEVVGHGKLLVTIELKQIIPHLNQISKNCLYLIKFVLGGQQLLANKQFLTVDAANGYKCVFFTPQFLKGRSISAKLFKVIENNMYQFGRFSLTLGEGEQQAEIISKLGKTYGKISLAINIEYLNKRMDRCHNKQNKTEVSELIDL